MNNLAFELKPDMVSVLRPLTDQPLNDFAEELMVSELYRAGRSPAARRLSFWAWTCLPSSSTRPTWVYRILT